MYVYAQYKIISTFMGRHWHSINPVIKSINAGKHLIKFNVFTNPYQSSKEQTYSKVIYGKFIANSYFIAKG